MPNQLDLSISVSGQGSLTDIGESIWAPLGAFQLGSGGFDLPTITYTHGLDDDQATELFVYRDTVAAGDTIAYDLHGGIDNFRGQAITFEAIKFFLLQIVDPDGNKNLFVGPQSVANACDLWFGGASDSEQILDWVVRPNRWGGWPVTSGNKLLVITNPTTGDVDFNLVIVGTTASDETG